MDTSVEIIMASEPALVLKSLLNPAAMAAWWGCCAVIDARSGGLWSCGWGQGPDEVGHASVLQAVITNYVPGQQLTLQAAETALSFFVTAHPQGTMMTLSLGNLPEGDQSVMQSWCDSMASLKAWVEQAYPFQAPAQMPSADTVSAMVQAPEPVSAPKQPPQATPQATPSPKGHDPFAGLGMSKGANAKVVDEGGFGVTEPHAVIKSWSKEQGFGYVTHSQLGDVSFDYNGCDFEPAVGDEVLLLVIAKRYDGKPKIKRIACPAKGSNIS